MAREPIGYVATGLRIKMSPEEAAKRLKINEIWHQVTGAPAHQGMVASAEDWMFLIALLDHKDN